MNHAYEFWLFDLKRRLIHPDAALCTAPPSLSRHFSACGCSPFQSLDSARAASPSCSTAAGKNIRLSGAQAGADFRGEQAMSTQSKTWQRKHLATATERGELDQLYWFIEMKVPLQHRKSRPRRWPHGGGASRLLGAGDSGGARPGDQRAVGRDADRVFQAKQPAVVRVCAGIDRPGQDGLRSARSGMCGHDGPPKGDTICPDCGGVNACHCTISLPAGHLASIGLYRVTRAYVDGVMITNVWR
jgi:hypothetical protein